MLAATSSMDEAVTFARVVEQGDKPPDASSMALGTRALYAGIV